MSPPKEMKGDDTDNGEDESSNHTAVVAHL